MYQIGELVLYGGTGVCRVSEIKEQSLPGSKEKRLYYILTPLYESCTISAPVDSDKVFIRPIISRDEAISIIEDIPNVQPEEFHCRVTRELSEHYESLLHSHDCRTLVELTMSIYHKKQEMLKQKRKFGAVDERFLKRAEGLLFGELAAALQIPRDKVQEHIEEMLESEKEAG